MKIGDKFKMSNGEIHIIKDIMEDGIGKYIIGEDGIDYGYIGENDKTLLKHKCLPNINSLTKNYSNE